MDKLTNVKDFKQVIFLLNSLTLLYMAVSEFSHLHRDLTVAQDGVDLSFD